MKRILIGALALIMTAGAAQAQEKGKTSKHHKGTHEMRKAHEDKSFEKLNLTEAQKSQVKTIMENQRNEMQALKNSNLSKEESMAKRKTIHEKYKSQLQSVLTAEQISQMQQMKSHRGEGKFTGARSAKSNRAAFAKGFAAGKMSQELNLTDAQKQKFQELRKNFQSKAQAIRSNNSLTQEQKNEQMKTLINQQKEQTKSILTAEQIKKLESSKAERRNRIS